MKKQNPNLDNQQTNKSAKPTRVVPPAPENDANGATAVANPAPIFQRAMSNPASFSTADAATLQRTIGNQALHRLAIQRKMTVGPVGDSYEQEADAVAKQVVGQLSSPAVVQRQEEDELQMKLQRQEDEEALQMKPLPPISSLQRQEDEEELQMKPQLQRQEEEELQMKPLAQRQEEEELQAKGDPMLAGGELSGDVESSVQSAKAGGQPMPDNVRAPLEKAFNTDFSSVKLHTDSAADSLNRSLSARAFTTGQDIFFRSGEYNPGSTAGQELLAHELTHTVQQSAAPTVQRGLIQDLMARLAGQGLVDPTTQKAAIIKRIKENYGVDLNQDAGINAIKSSYANAPQNVRDGLKAKDWTLKELQDVEKALSRYGALLGPNRNPEFGDQPVTTFSRLEQGIDEDTASGTLDNTTAGETFPDSKNITMFDAGTTVTDFAKDKANPTAEEHRTGFRGTIEHELSHALIENLRVGGSKKIIRQWASALGFWKGLNERAFPGSKGDSMTAATAAGVEVPPTKYGATNAAEDLAESLMFYFEDPEGLKTKCPKRYKFIVDVIEPVLNPQDAEEEEYDVGGLFD